MYKVLCEPQKGNDGKFQPVDLSQTGKGADISVGNVTAARMPLGNEEEWKEFKI